MTDLRGTMVVVIALLAGCSGRSAKNHREPSAGAPALAGVGGGSGSAGRATGGSGGSAATAAIGGTSAGGDGSGRGGGPSGGGEGGELSGGTAGAGTGGRSGGAGGSSGAGSSGAGSSGMPAGGGPSDFPPACVRTLTASCALEGACTFALTSTSRVARACYASGTVVTYDYSNEGACMPGDETTAQVYASDGSLCFTTVRTMGAGCESSSVTWLDAAGNPVATESTPYPGTATTIACEDGAGASCKAPCDVLLSTCEVGDCPSP